MSKQESDFITSILSRISTLPIQYPDHYTYTPIVLQPKKVHPKLTFDQDTQHQQDDLFLSIQVKQLKSKFSYTFHDLNAKSMTIVQLKSLIYTEFPHLVNQSFRLLYKGKCLNDDFDKCLYEYPVLKQVLDNGTEMDKISLNLVVNPKGTPMDNAKVEELQQLAEDVKEDEPKKNVSAPVVINKGDPINVPWACFLDNQAFWKDIRAVVDKRVSSDHPELSGGDGVAVFNALKKGFKYQLNIRQNQSQ